ncbi:MAG: ABC transporter substrate-binding protein [Bacteroidales bacterium]|nr:ABC transporter substrate-binding protein [Lachnoclostridium sp.]MCM1383079.1 ABC transporter substrate-binding protein [Lachnoclostridium sp.]MCM1463864.1 ABC transporter substrate-binding protein [Bacteroidales bacterium]
MRKMKKFLSVVVASAMVLAMAGCGNNNASQGSSAAGGNESQTQESSAGTDASNTGAGTSASADGVFKIGGMGPLTGGAAIYGLNVRNAAQIAVDEINAAGGVTVNGKSYQLELRFEDDEHDAEKVISAYNTVKDWGAQMVLGAVTSGPSIAVSEETYRDNMFQLTPSGSAVKCTQYDNGFRVCFSDPDQGAASAQYIGEQKLAQKIAIIYDSSTDYSKGIYESFVKGAKDQSFEIVAQEAFTADSNTDFSVQLQKAQSAGADLVFLPIYYQESALILKQADQMGYAPKFFSCDGMDGILTVENFDTKLAEGVMLLTPFAADAKDDLTQKFVKTYQEKYGEIPNQFAADAYDGVYALKAAIEKSGVTPDMSTSEICEGLKTGITSITLDGLTGAGMTWNASGEPNKAPKAVKIQDGAYVAM